jgi:pSer/pThr/pTyr-binding forkhead associated (FHA) protein
VKKISIGRDPQNNFYLSERTVSRQHAQILFHDQDQIELIDLGSTHGTFIKNNGELVRIQKQLVKPEDLIVFGQIEEHTVEEIVDDLISKTQHDIDGDQTRPPSSNHSVTRVRCGACKSVVVKEWSECPFCGGKL